MRINIISAVLIFGLLLSCSIRQPAVIQTKFEGIKHKSYLENSSNYNIVKGQGFLRQQGGGIVTCAGSRVVLFPVTPFFQEMVDLIRAGKNPQFDAHGSDPRQDPTYKKVVRETQCDAQGNFFFTAIPSGRWYVTTQVEWRVGSYNEGGALIREFSVNVNSGETKILLSNNDFFRH